MHKIIDDSLWKYFCLLAIHMALNSKFDKQSVNWVFLLFVSQLWDKTH